MKSPPSILALWMACSACASSDDVSPARAEPPPGELGLVDVPPQPNGSDHAARMFYVLRALENPALDANAPLILCAPFARDLATWVAP